MSAKTVINERQAKPKAIRALYLRGFSLSATVNPFKYLGLDCVVKICPTTRPAQFAAVKVNYANHRGTLIMARNIIGEPHDVLMCGLNPHSENEACDISYS